MASYVNGDKQTYFGSFGFEYVPKENKFISQQMITQYKKFIQSFVNTFVLDLLILC